MRERGSSESVSYLKRSEWPRDYRKLTHFFHSQPGNITRRVLFTSCHLLQRGRSKLRRGGAS